MVQNSSKEFSIARYLFYFALFTAAVSTVVGMTFFSTEDGGPARYTGLVSLLTGILALILLQRAKKRGELKTRAHTWMYWFSFVVIIGIGLLILFGFISIAKCASDSSCQLLSP